MSCPFSALELRDLISKLEVLERWQSQEEEGRGAQASARGYKRGDCKGRAVAARLPVTKTEFPAILQIARLWELEEDAGPAFVNGLVASLVQ